jgi:hypothetical protein
MSFEALLDEDGGNLTKQRMTQIRELGKKPK